MNQLEALQNMANHAGQNITVHQKQPEDNRNTVPRFFAQIGNNTISPVLHYAELNFFLMGYAKGNTSEIKTLEEIDKLSCNCPLMSLQAQHEFERCKEAEAYKIALAGVVIKMREVARAAIAKAKP